MNRWKSGLAKAVSGRTLPVSSSLAKSPEALPQLEGCLLRGMS